MASKAAAEPANGAVKDPEQEQQKQAGLAREAVQKQSYYMKRAIDEGNMRDALKHSSAMLGELRTSKLTPPNYYELYMRVFDELQMLSVFFAEDVKNGRNVSELYELVQHASHIVPRMYLLCTVGSVYIQTKEAPARDVLKDLVEMCRGVQHPIRGLFLRSYLAQTCKKLLPDVGSEYEGAGGTVEDAIDFVLQNFTEMNKLWVRMQQQGRATERAGREKERRELRELVGRNLVVLSQLDGVTLQAYSSTVLPRVLEQIVNCKDEIAQFYLMDAVIQVFSDDFHLHTLDTLLQAVPQLQIGVDVVTIMNRLMERLAAYASSSGELMAGLIEVQAFEKLRSAVNEVVVSYGDGLPLESVIMLHAALLSFALHCYRDELQYVNSVLESAAKVLSKTPNISDTSVVRSIVKLLTKPLEAYKDVCTVLELSSYPQVAGTLQFVTAKAMAIEVINAILSSGTIISQVVQVEKLFSFLRLLVDNDEIPEDEEIDEEELEEEQVLVSKVLHQLWNDDTDVCFEILECIRTHLLKGGPERTVYTLSPLAFLALRLERAVRERVKAGNTLKVSVKKVLQFLHSTLEILVNQCDAYEIGLRLLLLSAESAAQAGLEAIAYEFCEQAFIVYEENISETRMQITALKLIVGTMNRCHVFGSDNREVLSRKATQYSATLLKKTDQCRAVCTCSHLFYSQEDDGAMNNSDSLIACLKRSLKIANNAQQNASHLRSRNTTSYISLFVEVLNYYLYFFSKGLPEVTPKLIQDLIELVKSEFEEKNNYSAEDSAFFQATEAHIKYQKAKGVDLRFNEINI